MQYLPNTIIPTEILVINETSFFSCGLPGPLQSQSLAVADQRNVPGPEPEPYHMLNTPATGKVNWRFFFLFRVHMFNHVLQLGCDAAVREVSLPLTQLGACLTAPGPAGSLSPCLWSSWEPVSLSLIQLRPVSLCLIQVGACLTGALYLKLELTADLHVVRRENGVRVREERRRENRVTVRVHYSGAARSVSFQFIFNETGRWRSRTLPQCPTRASTPGLIENGLEADALLRCSGHAP